MVLLDLDLVSCYTCICLGLYRNQLYYIEVVKSAGIWKVIQQEFKDLGVHSMFFKPYVKTCFYASLFGGGVKAMLGGVVKNQAKNAGITLPEFEKSEKFL